MECVLCAGATEPRLVETAFAVGKSIVPLLDVTADVCSACGEIYYELAIYEAMERDARDTVLRRAAAKAEARKTPSG